MRYPKTGRRGNPREPTARALVEAAPVAMVVVDLDARVQLWNAAAERLLGWSAAEVSGTELPLAAEGDQTPVAVVRHVVRRGSAVAGVDVQVTARDGTRLHLRLCATPLPASGPFDSVLLILNDITGWQRSEAALRRSERRYRRMVERSPEPQAVYAEGIVVYINPAGVRALGAVSRRDIVGRRILDFVHPAYRELAAARMRLVEEERQQAEWVEEKLVRLDGEEIDAEILAAPIRYRGQKAVQVVIRDVTERKRAQEALMATEARFQMVVRATNDAVWEWEFETDEVWWNESVQTLFGYAPEEMSLSHDFWTDRIHPLDRERVLASMHAVIESGGHTWVDEYRFRRADGSYAEIFDRGYVIHDAGGRPVRMIGAMMDVTERKALEQQLLQAQKMEAVGRLAGGIAHDFNNVLTAILGYCDFLLADIEPGDPRREDVVQVVAAAGRASALTRQLLAFSRKQVLQPKVLDLNALLVEIEKLLGRVIGERITIRTVLDPGIGRVRADPVQLEQVIMNLIVNARDAMPDGGTITIETRNVELDEEYARNHPDATPGRHVALCVSDTGIGMDAATRTRIFEPFFTTKEGSKGTGLGLSTVYGIVRQSGGHIWVYSEPDQGSTFKIFLPWAPGEVQNPGPPAPTLPSDGSETVLLIEDEELVKSVARRGLEAGGYTVLEAATGHEAIEVARGHPGPIDVAVADLVLPDVPGRELAARLRTLRPGLRVLFVSGYTDETIVQHGLSPGDAFLEKPFTPGALTRKLREVLEASDG